MSGTATARERGSLELSVSLTIAPSKGQSVEEAQADMQAKLVEYLTRKDFPLWEDFGASEADIAEAERTGEGLSWGGYDGPFITGVTVR